MKTKTLSLLLISIFSIVAVISGLTFLFSQISPQKKSENQAKTITNLGENSQSPNDEKSKSVATTSKDKSKEVSINKLAYTIKDPTKYRVEIPALTYHHISTVPDELSKDAVAVGLRVGPKTFENQMKALKDKGYKTLTIDEYEKMVVGDIPLVEKSILITIDDGYTDGYENAFPILKKLGLIGNFAIITEVLSSREYMSMDNVVELHKAGMGIMSHTLFHCQLAVRERVNGVNTYKDNPPGENLEPCPQFTYPGALTKGQVEYELKESRTKLEKAIGAPVNSLVYPYGNYNKLTPELAKKTGYEFAFTTKASVTPFTPETTLFELPRTTVGGQQTPELTGFFLGL